MCDHEFHIVQTETSRKCKNQTLCIHIPDYPTDIKQYTFLSYYMVSASNQAIKIHRKHGKCLEDTKIWESKNRWHVITLRTLKVTSV